MAELNRASSARSCRREHYRAEGPFRCNSKAAEAQLQPTFQAGAGGGLSVRDASSLSRNLARVVFQVAGDRVATPQGPDANNTRTRAGSHAAVMNDRSQFRLE